MNSTNVGVIVGRFQTSRLTPGHVHLINTALLQNDEVILYIGSTPVRNSVPDPIPFVWRCSMVQSDTRIQSAGKRFHILELPDRGDDAVWSRQLHERIVEALNGPRLYPIGSVRLYGSRDSSFLKGFDTSGLELPYEKVELLPFSNFSATELRKQIANKFPSGRESDDFIREGMIIASQQRFPMVVSTVDVAILDKRIIKRHEEAPEETQVGVWLGRKPLSNRFRFIGGFAEPNSPSDEADAIREAKEETGLEVALPTYIGNTLIDDWRMRAGRDKIRTRFFAARVVGGIPKAQDDIAAIKFVPLSDIQNEELVIEHGPLGQMFKDWLESKRGIDYMADFLCR